MDTHHPINPIPIVDTHFLLFVAALFVVNSHLEKFYPNSAFAGDGLIGYGLFFFVSGLGIALSAKQKARSFAEYYWRRIIRIYPTVWLVTIPAAAITDLILEPGVPQFFHRNLARHMGKFLWPTDNTFVGPLMVCYILLYILLRLRPPKSILISILLLFVPFVSIWTIVHSYGRDIYTHPLGAWMWHAAFFQNLLLGAYLGFRLPSAESLKGWRFCVDALAFVLVLSVYVALKTTFNGGFLKDFYPVLFLLLGAMLWLLQRIACNPRLHSMLDGLRPASLLVKIIGSCCLEVYFVHTFLVEWRWLSELPFPANIVLLWVIVIPLSYFLERVVNWVRSGFGRFCWRPAFGVGGLQLDQQAKN